jgi:hypothetical protein
MITATFICLAGAFIATYIGSSVVSLYMGAFPPSSRPNMKSYPRRRPSEVFPPAED